LEATVSPSHETDAALWIPPVLKTSALQNEGLDELVTQIEKHRQYLIESGDVRQLEARYIEIELYERLQQAMMRQITTNLPVSVIRDVIDKIIARELDPLTAVEQLLIQSR
jgi:LAO/AO transport system kinase